MRSRFAAAFALTIFLGLAPLACIAQGYPTKPVHIIVAFAPGGPVDVVARLVALRLPDLLGQPFVVENRPSSSGNLGTQVVAKAQPDGYTILATSSAFAVNVTLAPDAGYVPGDFAPIAPAGTPPEIVQKLNEAINAVLRMPDIRERLESLTLEPVGGSPQQFSDYVRAEVVKWGVVVKQTGAKVD